ncbi:MAG: hypothetical protein OHK0019_35740 [Saprospiraceae bacterium]
MNRDELLFDKIETYLRGKLPPAEAAAFEAEIAADPELAALVKIQRLEREGLEWLVERDLLAKMNSWEREVSGSSGGSGNPAMRVSFVRRWWAVGVAALLTLGAFGWWLMQPQADIGGPQPIVTAPKTKPPVTTPPSGKPKPSQKPPTSQPKPDESDDRVTDKPATPPSKTSPSAKPETKPTSPAQPAEPNYPALAATYYREQDFITKNGGATNGSNESPGYGQALDNYKSGKYGDVEKLLKPVLKNKPDALQTKELLAHSLYQRGQYAEALTYFRQLSGAKDKALAERSEWATALTLLHQMPSQKATLIRTLDKIIAQPGHAFNAKARELREKIGK